MEKKRLGCGKAILFGIGALIGLFILLALLAPKPTHNSAYPSATGTTGDITSSSASEGSSEGSFTLKKITADEYARLYTGMSYSSAVAVIGDPGEESSRTDMAGYSTVAYTWKNYDGSNAIVMFQNDRLVSKAQAGL